MTRKKRTEHADDSGYTRFLQSLQPIIVALVHSSSKVNRSKYLDSERDEINVRFRGSLTNLEEDNFDVKITLVITVAASGEKDAILRFGATYEVHFHGKELEEAVVRRFVETELRPFIWPFVREFVNMTSARMHVPPLVLPFSNSQEND